MSAETKIRDGAVPFLDLRAQHQDLGEKLVAKLLSALGSGVFVGGPDVLGFEDDFARFVGTNGAVAVNSGTDALRFAYMALDAKGGDEIITVPHTFIATTEAISQTGARVQFVDIEDDTMTMDPAALRQAKTSRTVGVVPVHLYGQPADMEPILGFARTSGLWVVEDAAQAHGAEYKGQSVGSFGDLAAFSFYPGKNLGACGEAGAIVGNQARLLDITRQLRDHGQSKKYFHVREGYNGRMDAIQAAFLSIKLPRLRSWNEARRRVARLYREALEDVSEVRLPKEATYARHVYHLFVIRVKERDRLQAYLTEHGIGTGLHYPLPLHLQDAYRDLGLSRGAYPVTEKAAAEVLSLPMFPEMTESQVEQVTQTLRRFYRSS